jgi:hypothetical protein
MYSLKQILVLVLLCLITGTTARSSERTRSSKIRAEYHKVRHYFSADKTWRNVPKEEISEVFRRLWTLVGAWTVTYLEETPHVTADDVTKKIEELRSVNAHTIQLVNEPQPTYVISADFSVDDFPVNGTFFIVTCSTDIPHCQVAWHIKDLAQTHYASGDEIGYWAYFSFPFIGYGGGALIGYVSELPPSKAGNPRFYIEAIAAAHGGTQSCQLSIWEWNGREARPLLIQNYQSTGDSGEVEFDGEFLKVPTKEQFKTTFTCGTCLTPRAIWTIRVTPDEIKDIGREYDVPELNIADELWARLLKSENADEIASPQVIEPLNQLIEGFGDTTDEFAPLSMLGRW